jgi:hypothetical protein
VSIRIRIPPFLSSLINKLDVVDVSGKTISQCLNDFVVRFPGVKRGLFDSEGKIADCRPLPRGSNYVYLLSLQFLGFTKSDYEKFF